MTSKLHVWGVFALFFAVMAMITALISLAAIPDFDRIAAYRIADGRGALAQHDVRQVAPAAMLLYLPHAGGAPRAIIGGGDAVALTSHVDARLTRNLQFQTLKIEPAMLGRPPTMVKIDQPDLRVSATLGPVYLGPEAVLRPVVEAQRWWGRLMQGAIPGAGLFAIAMSLLLVFFSRQPMKYMLLILAFTCQLIIELEVSPPMLGFRLTEYSQFIGVLTQTCIWLAVASWTGSKGHSHILILSSSLLVLLAFTLIEVLDVQAFPALSGVRTIVYAGWLVMLQLVNWRMVLTAKFVSNYLRAGTLACFLLSMTGLIAYRILSAGDYATEHVFFLSNWTNVATSFAVLIFVVGALMNEVQIYRRQRRVIGDLRSVAAGHHAELNAQQQMLRSEIERNAVLEERQRFMRELHDGIGNQLLGLMIKLRGTGPAAAPLTSDVQAVISELRLVTTALDEPHGNLHDAFSVLCERLDLQTSSAGVRLLWDVRLEQDGAMPPKLVLDVLRIVQECISNALKHSGANVIRVAVSGARSMLLVVEDNGCGFVPSTVSAGLGLRNIRARAADWGGAVRFNAGADGVGTRITINLVVPAAS